VISNYPKLHAPGYQKGYQFKTVTTTDYSVSKCGGDCPQGAPLQPVPSLVIGPRLEALLRQLPDAGPLFPRLRLLTEGQRASHFGKVCLRESISGVTLHSYRYGWAERACAAGIPEREAQSHLGHGSQAVHRAYAKRAEVVTLPLEHYEAIKDKKLLAFLVPGRVIHVSADVTKREPRRIWRYIQKVSSAWAYTVYSRKRSAPSRLCPTLSSNADPNRRHSASMEALLGAMERTSS